MYAEVYLGTGWPVTGVPDLIVYSNGICVDGLDVGIDEELLDDPVYELKNKLEILEYELQRDPEYCPRSAVVVCYGYRPRKLIRAIKDFGWPVTTVDAETGK